MAFRFPATQQCPLDEWKSRPQVRLRDRVRQRAVFHAGECDRPVETFHNPDGTARPRGALRIRLKDPVRLRRQRA